jgi:hypothetical protein
VIVQREYNTLFEGDGDRILVPASYPHSPECVEEKFSDVPRTKVYGILKNLWYPQESTTSIGSQASSLDG